MIFWMEGIFQFLFFFLDRTFHLKIMAVIWAYFLIEIRSDKKLEGCNLRFEKCAKEGASRNPLHGKQGHPASLPLSENLVSNFPMLEGGSIILLVRSKIQINVSGETVMGI